MGLQWVKMETMFIKVNNYNQETYLIEFYYSDPGGTVASN